MMVRAATEKTAACSTREMNGDQDIVQTRRNSRDGTRERDVGWTGDRNNLSESNCSSSLKGYWRFSLLTYNFSPPDRRRIYNFVLGEIVSWLYNTASLFVILTLYLAFFVL